jgi:hypothetical protein
MSIDRTKAILAGACALFLAAAADSIASAQAPATTPAPAQPWRMKNPKVLPADMPREQVIATMKRFAQSLGVRCTHCHVGEEGKPTTFDFASDAKKDKLIARDMMRLVGRLNAKDLPAINGLKDAKVTCYTCHRGAKKPETELPTPAVPPVPPAAS